MPFILLKKETVFQLIDNYTSALGVNLEHPL
jgi:hypothetical protein